MRGLVPTVPQHGSVSAPAQFPSITSLLVKLHIASGRWTKPFGGHGQVGADLLVEQGVKTADWAAEGLLVSGGACFSHAGK